MVSGAYDLVSECHKAGDQGELAYLDTIVDLHDLLVETADNLHKIDSTAPPLLFRRATNIRIALLRHKGRAAAEVKRRNTQQRLQELELAEKEAALRSPSTSKKLTPAEQAAAAAAEEEQRRAEAQYAADLAEWQKRYDSAIYDYHAACDKYDECRDALACIVFEGKGRYFQQKEELPEFVLTVVDEYHEAHRYDDTDIVIPPAGATAQQSAPSAPPSTPAATAPVPPPLMQQKIPPVKTPSKSTHILLNQSVDSATAEITQIKTVGTVHKILPHPSSRTPAGSKNKFVSPSKDEPLTKKQRVETRSDSNSNAFAPNSPLFSTFAKHVSSTQSTSSPVNLSLIHI